MSIRGRLTAATVALAATLVGLALASLYVLVGYQIERDADRAVARELADITSSLEGLGSEAREAAILQRSQRSGRTESIYLFESHQRIVAGNLDAWPKQVEGRSPEDMTWEEPSGNVRIVRHARAAKVVIGDGQNLLVGQDLTAERNLQDLIGVAAVGVFGFVVLLAVTGGVAIGRSLLQRVQGMNQTVLEIIGGNRSERVPVSGRGDEFDELAVHFNRLLDDNQKLLAQMKGVTDDIAHDLRTPLARMRNRIDAQLAAPEDERSSRETLHELQNETSAVLDTFSALLRIAQIESGVIRDQMEPVELAPIVEDAVELYQPVAEEAGLELEAHSEAGLTVVADRHLIAQTVLNLIDNAIKYTQRGGRVSVRAERANGRVEVTVCDDGPGIDAADQERVLQRFVRLDTSRHQPGTGLGLSFVAAVAELHHAELALEDAAPGLRVRLRFPEAARAAGA